MLEAYQAGITSLKEVAIDIDKVDQTMIQLEEVKQHYHTTIIIVYIILFKALVDHDEVSTALAEG